MSKKVGKVRVAISTPGGREDLQKIWVETDDASLVVALGSCIRAIDPPRMYELLAQLVHYLSMTERESCIEGISAYERKFGDIARDLEAAWERHDAKIGRRRPNGGLI